MERLKAEAEPTPNRSAVAVHTVVKGKATLVAALPSSPMLLPMEIWSTILYKAPTSMAMMLGTAKRLNSFPTVQRQVDLFYDLSFDLPPGPL